MEKLSKQIQEYLNQGLIEQVQKAAKRARGETREYIESTHPQTGFDGRSLVYDERRGRTNHQTVLGHFEIRSKVVSGNIYSSYFQRWANTGATQHKIPYGAYRGRLSTYYPARTNYYTSNKGSIEQHFAECLDRALKDFIKI